MLSLSRGQVQFLVRELWFHRPHSTAKKKKKTQQNTHTQKKQLKKDYIHHLCNSKRLEVTKTKKTDSQRVVMLVSLSFSKTDKGFHCFQNSVQIPLSSAADSDTNILFWTSPRVLRPSTTVPHLCCEPFWARLEFLSCTPLHGHTLPGVHILDPQEPPLWSCLWSIWKDHDPPLASRAMSMGLCASFMMSVICTECLSFSPKLQSP